MKKLFLIFAIIFAPVLQADEIKKWIDDDGIVHYGDKKADTGDAVEVERFKSDESFDQESYDDAMQRNAETEKVLEEYQQEREEKEKREREEAAMNRPVAPPSGGTSINYLPAIWTDSLYYNRPRPTPRRSRR